MQEKTNFRKYIFSGTTLIQIIIGAIVVSAIIVLAVVFHLRNLPDFWTYAEPLIGLSTLLVAAFIWYNEKRQDWKGLLPKKLNVCYMLNERVFATVKNAPLASEQDIRQWSLSIAQTIINNTGRVKFNGFFMGKPILNKNRETGYSMTYSIIYYLTEAIEGLDESNKHIEFDNMGKLILQNHH